MNVFEENQFLRQELEALRADLDAAESRLQQLQAMRDAGLKLTDDRARRVLTQPLPVSVRTQ